MKTYFVPKPSFNKVLNKISALHIRANKLGIEFNYAVGEPVVKEVTVYNVDGQIDLLNSPAMVTCYPVTCDDTSIVIDGWQIIGKIEKIDDANVFFGDVPDDYRGIENFYCDHCHTNRPSKHLFIIQDQDDDNIMAVGRGCLQDFTDNTNALEYVSFFQDIQLFDMMIKEPYRTGQNSDYILLEKYFWCVIQSFNQHGYVKTEFKNGTKFHAWDMYQTVKFGNAQLLEAKQTIEKIMQYLRDKRPLNSFEHNIYDYLNNVYREDGYSPLNDRMMGFIASSILLLEKADSFEIQGEFCFNPGDKIEVELIFVEKKFLYSGDFGDIWMYRFLDDNNNLFAWKTQNKDKTERVEGNQYKVTKKFEEGTRYKIKATLKEHKVYGEEKQNLIQRVRETSLGQTEIMV